MFTPKIKTRLDPRGTPYYWIDGIPYTEYEEKTDGYSLHIKKQPTITPLSLDLGVNLELLKEWI